MKVMKAAFLFTFIFLFFSFKSTFSQISVSSESPYDDFAYLVDSLLLGRGVVTSNHSFLGSTAFQIGFFNGIDSEIGLDSGIIMAAGGIKEVIPGPLGGTYLPHTFGDPDYAEINQDLLDLADCADLIGQDFTVPVVNKVALLEFDFIPVSTHVLFNYVFATEEYATYENTQFNDVMGIFLSGPGIVGPYSSPPEFPNGSINIATFESVEDNSLGINLPVTASTLNGSYNAHLYISNQEVTSLNTIHSEIRGFTVNMIAEAEVVCGYTYHIRIAVADGSLGNEPGFLWLSQATYYSPLNVTNSLGVDSNVIFTNCADVVTLRADVDTTSVLDFLWSTGDTTQSVSVPPGTYWVQATDSLGCTLNSDTIIIYSQPIPEIVLPNEDYFCVNESHTIVPNVSGGTPPFTYSWLGLADTSHLEVSQEGNYTLVVSDVNNCSDTAVIGILQHPLPEITYVPEEIIICSGSSVTVSVEGAETYKWSPNIALSSDTGKTVEITALSSISYTVEGTDSIGCSTSIYVPVSANESFDLDIITNSVSCQGYSDGSITILPQNTAIPPIQYSIDGGHSYQDYYVFSNLDFGTYDVWVQDGLGCVSRDTAFVGSSAPEIELIVSSSNSRCFGDSTGKVWVSHLSGGNISSSYSYKWYNSSTNELVGTDSVLHVPAAAYFLIVEDDNGCRVTDEVNVEQPMPLSYDITKKDISCFGESDGEIVVEVQGGGSSPYDYDWVNYGNASTSFLYHLEKGTYDLQITDFSDCVTSLSFDIEESLWPLSSQISSTNVECHGQSTATASVNVSGGAPPYSYEWSSGHVTAVAEQIPSGVYSVEVTDSRACVITDSVQIYENDEIVSVLSSTPTSCYGSQDGTASVIASGGTGSLTYSWSNGSSSSAITSVNGAYWLIIEDELGCQKIDTVLIKRPANISITLISTDVSCRGDSDGKIISHVKGGTPFINQTYTYSWSIDGNPIAYNNPSANFLPASTLPYALEVVDANGCSQTAYAFISEPSKLVVDTVEVIASYCQNIPAGQALVAGSGGFLEQFGEYSFSWSTGDTGAILQNQTSGFYTVVVEDDNSCKDSLIVEIPLDDKFHLNITSDSLNCYDDASGTATVVTTGGYAPFTYSWNTSDGIISQEISSASNNTIVNLAQGVTSVVVRDVNGCAKTTQVNVGQPAELVFSVFKEFDESCSGEVSACDGVLRVQAEGGTGSYNFKCLDASNNLISSSQSNIEALFTSLCADFYQVVVEDGNGCLASASGNGLTVPVEILAGTPVESAINTSSGSISNSIVCYGDTAVSVTVLNPNPSYTYEWYVDAHLFSSGLNAVLAAGEIHLRAISSPNCYTNSESISINQPSQLTINQEIGHVSCKGGDDGVINIDGVGGNSPYTFNWSSSSDGLGVSQNINDLTAGVYTLTLKDASNCERQFEIEVLEPSSLSASSVVQDVSCNGGDDGSAILSVSGGTPPHSINWQNSDSTSLSAGIYEVIISDANNCLDTIDVVVSQPTAIAANFNSNQTPFVANASGGSSPYTFKWLYFGNYQSSGTTFNPTENGEYTLVAVDSMGCESRLMQVISNIGVEVSEFEKSKLLIYPNPASTHFIVELDSDKDDEVLTLHLIDARGRLVKDVAFTKFIQIDRDDLSNGLYFIQISSEQGSHQESIVFE